MLSAAQGHQESCEGAQGGPLSLWTQQQAPKSTSSSTMIIQEKVKIHTGTWLRFIRGLKKKGNLKDKALNIKPVTDARNLKRTLSE
jgi:hypothetical protein